MGSQYFLLLMVDHKFWKIRLNIYRELDTYNSILMNYGNYNILNRVITI